MHAREPTARNARVFNAFVSRRLAPRTLAFGVSLALAGSIGVSTIETAFAAVDTIPGPTAPTNWIVKNCDDSGQDSLRDIVENPMNAKSGDSVDLSELPVRCGMIDSKITLAKEIVIAQDDLRLYGPAKGTVTISGANSFRVFHHTGAATLSLNVLTIADGYFHDAGNAYGGCIESEHGSLSLSHVVVTGCVVASDAGYANGGGVSADSGNVSLVASRVTGNEARSAAVSGWGGGVYSKGTTFAWYSSISGNKAEVGIGGGILASGVTIIATTIDSNSSGYGGGLRRSMFRRSSTARFHITLQGCVAVPSLPTTTSPSPIARLRSTRVRPADQRPSIFPVSRPPAS
jgi:hypothetical protein